MLSSVSWQQYFSFIAIVTTLYYLALWVIYYKAKLLSFSGLKAPQSAGNEEVQREEVAGNAQLVIDEIKTVFAGRESRNELIHGLQGKLKKYNQWDEPGFREIINAFITAESENKCSIHLSEEDLSALWL